MIAIRYAYVSLFQLLADAGLRLSQSLFAGLQMLR
jgi:hypothetical protein